MTMASSTSGGGGGSASWPNLYEFLLEAELAHYYNALKNDLKVASISQLKYVEEDDLAQVGMTKPEQRRLRKFFNKYYPQNYIMKIKKMILPKSKEDPDRTSILFFDSTIDRNSVRVPSKHIISADTIVINKELGVGEFGVVQQGVWTNEDGERIQVAIKCLNKARMQNNYMEFLKEAAIMHTIDHEHIVRLYGVVLDTSTLMLVTELAPLRSLLECLKEPALRPSFPVISLCEFALQICQGMDYLESKRLIHRDLAARNVLVFAKNNVKISDFGLSRALGVGKDYYQTNFNVNLKLPIAWCAPECINFLRFTSASDVWAYGVTLWEMFSYGFQPWAALTGQQILEAIDEPNFQNLEQPECCPKEYYTLMLKCWQHDLLKRPKFAEILHLLPDCKAEQVQAVKDSLDLTSTPKTKKEWLQYHIGDVITVLDKRPLTDSGQMWKGVLTSGKTGLFNPANFVAYLGSNLPTNRPSFSKNDHHGGSKGAGGSRGDGGINGGGVYASSRRRLRPDMISGPQGDCKHTGHVGLDGAFFGDISFLGDKCHQLPKQVVTPYKPQEDRERSSLTRASSDLSDKAPLLMKSHSLFDGKNGPAAETWSMTGLEDCKDLLEVKSHKTKLNGGLAGSSSGGGNEKHEYHEISDTELLDDDDFASIESPRFESLDFGPSLMDEIFKTLSCNQTDFELEERESNENNVKNEIKEIIFTSKTSKMDQYNNTGGKNKKQATVKPISAQDQQTLESAIAMAKELASQSMMESEDREARAAENDLGGGEGGRPGTPNSPGANTGAGGTNNGNGNNRHSSKFSFKFKSSPKQERRKFSEEAQSIPNIQDTLSQEAKEVYNSLVDKGQASGGASVASSSSTSSSSTSNKNNNNNNTDVKSPTMPPLVDATQFATFRSSGRSQTSTGTESSDVESESTPSAASASASASIADSNPLRMLRTGMHVRPKIRGNKHGIPSSGRASTPHTAGVARLAANANSINNTPSFSSFTSSTPSSTTNTISTATAATSSATSSTNLITTMTSSRASLGAPPPPPPSSIASSSSSQHLPPPHPMVSKPLEFVIGPGADLDSNPLPLPPRDRTRPSLPALKQHQRKYPLLMTNSDASATSNSTITASLENSSSDGYRSVLSKHNSCPPSRVIEDVFVDQDAADASLHTYSNVLVRRREQRRYSRESAAVSGASGGGVASSLSSSHLHQYSSREDGDDGSVVAKVSGAPMAVPECSSPESPPPSNDDPPSSSFGSSSLSSPNNETTNSTAKSSSVSSSSSAGGVTKNRKTSSFLDDSFETRIQAEIDGLDELPMVEGLGGVGGQLYKSGDHVSCEDLLEFASDKPYNAQNTRGRSRGAYSDEVRIMQKVLTKEVQ